jgi:hypothetical protein
MNCSQSGNNDNNNIANNEINNIIDHTGIKEFNSIPDSEIINAKSKLHIAYGHTSHGSQLITGMNAIHVVHGIPYNWNEGGTEGALDIDDYAMGGDAGYYPQWVSNTKSYLGDPDPDTGRGTNDVHTDVNVIIWSWCGQLSQITEQKLNDEYLDPMTQLETEYPGITFVYMTGHADGSGLSGNLHLRNKQIREYCKENKKILFSIAFRLSQHYKRLL